ncbi:hypothetical protein BJX64DRAFT_266865 [Aspergillus heterothallicus]
MQQLPIEIIQYICLLARDADASDAYSTRLVSRRCCLAATPVVFENLTIKLRAGSTAYDPLFELHDSRLAHNLLQYTRRLSLVSIRHWLPHQTTLGLGELAPNLFGYIPSAASDLFLERDLTTAGVPGSNYERWKWIFNFYNPQSWKPLVELIAKFHRLVELNYGLADMFPRALGEAVRNHHPHCVLNIWNGYHPTEARPPSQQLSPNIIASHNPSSFVAICPAPDNRYTSDEIYINLLSHILPGLSACSNLKHLTIHWGHPASICLYDDVVEEWRSLPRATCPVQLQSLTFQGSTPFTKVLYAMAKLFDLSHLYSLDVTAFYNPYVLREASILLRRLLRLYISMDSHFLPNVLQDNPETLRTVLSFNPLQFLRLCGAREQSTIREILAVHGSTLRGLILETVQYGSGCNSFFNHHETSHSNISEIAELCPNLQELRIPITRTMGDRSECVKYRALGGFSQLRTLVIDLICDPKYSDPYESTPSMAGRIKYSLINSAIDKHLVSSIWNIIFNAQSGKRLRQLSCIHVGSGCYPWPQEWVMLQLGQSFLVRRSDFDTVIPLEILTIGRKSLALRMEEKYRTGHQGGMDKILNEVFDELWPGEGPWETRWRSFPLDTLE